MSIKPIEYQLEPWVDFGKYLGDDFDFVSVNLGPRNELLVLAVSKPADFREVYHGASFPKIKADQPHDYVVLRIDEWSTHQIDIKQQLWNYHDVQPLPTSEILMVCTRSRYHGRDVADLNGRVFGEDGSFRREFLLGDGIQSVQTTTDGMIWTSYFDEGVFGNYGWRHPIGESGLIKWNGQGHQVYSFSPPSGVGGIIDCYAFNAVSKNEAWCYYYTEFPLVQIRDDRALEYWNCPIRGSDGFIIFGKLCLFRGGYDNRNEYHLMELANNHSMNEINHYVFTDETGQIIQTRRLSARGSMMVLAKGTICYRIYISELQ